MIQSGDINCRLSHSDPKVASSEANTYKNVDYDLLKTCDLWIQHVQGYKKSYKFNYSFSLFDA